jgi:hypothetical protein
LSFSRFSRQPCSHPIGRSQPGEREKGKKDNAKFQIQTTRQDR